MYYIATNKKTKPWENPAKTNKIFVTTSSGYKPDYLDPTVCVNHDGHGEFSTDINDSREAGQWVCIDLGLNKPIEPNYYCLKGPGTIAHCMKNWNLEGSNDTIIWDILSTHIEEKTTWETHNTLAISYPIKMCRKKYRYFRIISTGKSYYDNYYFVRTLLKIYLSFRIWSV